MCLVLFGLPKFVLIYIRHLIMTESQQKYWVLTADMGYGHQRAINPFSKIAFHRIINMNNDAFAPRAEQKYWQKILWAYEFVSRVKEIPLIGGILFWLMNRLLRIPDNQSIKDLSRPTYQVKLLGLQVKKGLCRGVINTIKKNEGPVITSFYAPAVAADMAGFKDIYCIICDADLNRVWVSKNPFKSNITYFVPGQQAADRLKMYGVPEKRIVLTGFPLHPDLLGNKNLNVAKNDFCKRLKKLLPAGNNHIKIPDFCSANFDAVAEEKPLLSISFAVGGAGAQADLARRLLVELKGNLDAGKVHLNLIAGVRPEVRDYFNKWIKKLDAKNTEVVFEETKNRYFSTFNRVMRNTDMLITKPSELTFFAGLGIPILMTSPVGSQEEFNRKWLLEHDAAIDFPQKGNLAMWIAYGLTKGLFARLAINGFEKLEKSGFYNIMNYLESRHGQGAE